MRYLLGLGSNLGKRESHLRECRTRLTEANILIAAISSVYETEPVGPVEQPWFLNQVVSVEFGRSPVELLHLTQEIERTMGRPPDSHEKARIIDIDMLLAEDIVFRNASLIIPHPRLHRRKFVLLPLKEIAPDAVHPVFKLTVAELCRRCQDTSVVRRYSLYR